jgi:hypothetical protein
VLTGVVRTAVIGCVGVAVLYRNISQHAPLLCMYMCILSQAAGGLKNDFECDDMVINQS